MCAIIRRGILGGFSNKIGNVVGTSWKGIAIMKALPLSVANPRTTAQTVNRGAFSTASKLGSILLAPIIKPLWDRFAQAESGFNAFVRENKEFCEAVGVFAPFQIVISKGKMAAVTPTSAVTNAGDNAVILTWPTALPDAFSAPNDEAYVVIIKQDTLQVRGIATGILRSAGTATIQFELMVPGDVVWALLAFRRADGSVVSDTGYAQVTGF